MAPGEIQHGDLIRGRTHDAVLYLDARRAICGTNQGFLP